MAGLAEYFKAVQKGQKTDTFPYLQGLNKKKILDDDQIALMSMVCKKCDTIPTVEQINAFFNIVEKAQKLMPTGDIRSRQIITIFAMQAGLE